MTKLLNYLKDINQNEKSVSRFSTVKIYIVVFFLGCVTGWIYEEIFYFVTEGIIEKRGFMYGPYLPVYGFGSIFILLFLKRFKAHPVVIFVGTIFISGVLEYATGYVMLKVWDKRWWDYTGLFMDLDGFVCLRSVLSFAIMAIFLVYLLEPLVRQAELKINSKVFTAICGIIIGVMSIDYMLTLLIRNPIG